MRHPTALLLCSFFSRTLIALAARLLTWAEQCFRAWFKPQLRSATQRCGVCDKNVLACCAKARHPKTEAHCSHCVHPCCLLHCAFSLHPTPCPLLVSNGGAEALNRCTGCTPAFLAHLLSTSCTPPLRGLKSVAFRAAVRQMFGTLLFFVRNPCSRVLSWRTPIFCCSHTVIAPRPSICLFWLSLLSVDRTYAYAHARGCSHPRGYCSLLFVLHTPTCIRLSTACTPAFPSFFASLSQLPRPSTVCSCNDKPYRNQPQTSDDRSSFRRLKD